LYKWAPVLILVHTLLAGVEFLLINWIGRHSISAGYYPISLIHEEERSPVFNLVFRILAPTVFLIVTAALWYSVHLDRVVQQYWRVTLFYFVLRWTFNVVTGRRRLVRWVNQVVVAGLATGLSYLTYQQLLADRSILLPSARGLTDQVWIVVILFLYSTYNQLSVDQTRRAARDRREDYIKSQYATFKRSYGFVVQAAAGSTIVEAIAYSVMVYESFNRPPLYQWIEKWLLHPLGLAKSLGPMQVQVKRRLPDIELVRVGVRKIREDWDQVWTHNFGGSAQASTRSADSPGEDSAVADLTQLSGSYRESLVRATVASYNVRSDYPDQVLGIYATLMGSYYRELES
jgi:hypothetical protein